MAIGGQLLTEWLVGQRKALGLTQAQLGEKLGLNKVSLNKIENAQRRIDICEFCDICTTLQSNPSDVIKQLIHKSKVEVN